MTTLATAAAGAFGAWWAERVAAGQRVPLAVAAGLVLAGLVLGVVLWAVARHRFRREMRTIVEALETLRSGRGRATLEVSRGSRLGLVADAVHRLGVELQGTRSAAEATAERWRAVSDATRDTAIVTTDTDGDVRSFSPGATRLTGWEEGEVQSRPAAVLFEEQAYKDLLPKLARRSLRAQGVTTRSTVVRRDGTRVAAEVSVRLLLGPASQPVGFLMLMRDISEQMRMEDELRDAERRFRGLVEGLREGVVIVKAGCIVYVNPAAERLCGEKTPALLGTAWRDRVATHDVLVTEAALESAARGIDGARTLRCTLRGPAGEERASVRVQSGPVEFAGGPAVLLLVQDETAERRAEEELRRNEALLDAVLEATSDGVLVLTDDPGRMVQVTNRAFAETFGLRPETLLGASADRLARLLDSAAEGAGALVDQLERGGEVPAVVALGRAGEREVEVRVATLAGRDGASLGRVVTCRDVTARRRSERELQDQADRLQLGKLELERAYSELSRVHGELEQRSGELDRLNRELRRLDTLKTELIGNVSHELQTPLVSIRGYTEMILKERLGPISEEQRKGLTLSLRNIDRLIAMIDNLLAFTRTDPELRELELTRFPLRPLLEEARDLMRDAIAAKALDVTIAPAGEVLEVRADRNRILQVVLNLLSNAVKFSQPRGRIEIAAGCAGGLATVAVRDEGVGIPEESRGRIFERHFQVRPPAEGGPTGSGLGLAIVRDILRLHGCTIEVESREGQGSEFTFTLPLADAGGRAGAPRPAEPLPAGAAAGPTEIGEAPRAPEPGAPDATTPTSRPRLRIIRRYRSQG